MNKQHMETIFTAVEQDVDAHEDNPQLLLILAVYMNDIEKVRKVLEDHAVDPSELITPRNQTIINICKRE